MARHSWATQRFPQDLKRLDRLERAATDTERAASLATGFVDQLTDAKLITDAEALERKAAEALKSVNG